MRKMDFPIQNVIQNVRHFIDVVKKETGNTADRKGDLGSKGGKACMPISRLSNPLLMYFFLIKSSNYSGLFSAHNKALESQFLTSNS